MRIETSSSRLRALIERRGYRMGAFAEMSGVTPTTLSKFVNGSRNMSVKYINRAAELLGVTPEYLLCESDEMIPAKYLGRDQSAEMLVYNAQQYVFEMMQELLTRMEVDTIHMISIAGKKYIKSGQYYHTVDGDSDHIAHDELLALLREHCDQSDYRVELSYTGRKISLTYSDYQRLLRRLTTMMELELQGIFDISYDLSLAVADTDIDRALRGEQPLE